MADKQDVRMTIFGQVPSVEFVQKLAGAMISDQAQSDWNEGEFNAEDEALIHIAEALETGSPIEVYREETANEFGDVAHLCRRSGMSYRIEMETSAHLPARLVVYSPEHGADEPDVNDQHEVVMKVADVLEMMRKDPAEGLARLEAMKAKALEGVLPVTTMADGVAEGLDDLMYDGEAPKA